MNVSFDNDSTDTGNDSNNDTELKRDDAQEQQEVVQPEVAEVDDEQPSGSVSDSDGEHEEKAVAQTKVEERIGELTRKRKEAERLAEERLNDLQKLQSQMLETREPVIPDLPDPDMVSESDYRQAISQRDKAITDRVAWQQEKQSFQSQQQQREQNTQQQKLQTMHTAAQTYTANATKLGVTQAELAQASQVINQVGLNDDVAMHILQDEQGAAITRYLGMNVNDLLEVSQSDPIRAALYIEQKIKPKLNPVKRKSGTPPPPNRTKGGSPDKRDRFPLTGSAKFE